MTEQMWIEKLGLEAHPEGVYFKQTNNGRCIQRFCFY